MHQAVDDLDPIAKPQDPTDVQREMLFAIAEFWSRNGYPPSFRDLMNVLHIKSTNGISEQLERLARKLLVFLPDGNARAVRPTIWGWAAMGIRAEKPEPALVAPTDIECRLCGRKVKHVALAKSLDFRFKGYVVHWKAMAHECEPRRGKR